MDFINQVYDSGEGYLFGETSENPSKIRCTFSEFMRYLSIMSTFEHSSQEYKQALDIMDQDGDGKEANNEDIKRVMRTYSSLTEE